MHKTLLAVLLIVLDVGFIIAKERHWYEPSGVRFRYGTHNIVSETDIESQIRMKSSLIDPHQTTLFPVLPTFPETLFGSFVFGEMFVDWNLNKQYELIEPYPSQTDEYSSLTGDRATVIRQILESQGLSQSTYCGTSYLNCVFYGNYIETEIRVGYMLGAFWPIGNHNRLFKVAYGLSAELEQFENDIHICAQPSFYGDRSQNPNTTRFTISNCQTTAKLGRVLHDRLWWGELIFFMLFERKTEDYMLSFFKYQFSFKRIDTDLNNYKVFIKNDYTYTEIISYEWIF